MSDAPQDSVEPRTSSPIEESLPWYKRTPVIIAITTSLIALMGACVKVALPRIGSEPPKMVPVSTANRTQFATQK